MKLAEAVTLKEGTILVSDITCGGPSKLTKGRTYVMQGNAIPVYLEDTTTTRAGRRDNKSLCNVDLPIIDNSSRFTRTCYIHFEVS